MTEWSDTCPRPTPGLVSRARGFEFQYQPGWPRLAGAMGAVPTGAAVAARLGAEGIGTVATEPRGGAAIIILIAPLCLENPHRPRCASSSPRPRRRSPSSRSAPTTWRRRRRWTRWGGRHVGPRNWVDFSPFERCSHSSREWMGQLATLWGGLTPPLAAGAAGRQGPGGGDAGAARGRLRGPGPRRARRRLPAQRGGGGRVPGVGARGWRRGGETEGSRGGHPTPLRLFARRVKADSDDSGCTLTLLDSILKPLAERTSFHPVGGHGLVCRAIIIRRHYNRTIIYEESVYAVICFFLTPISLFPPGRRPRPRLSRGRLRVHGRAQPAALGRRARRGAGRGSAEPGVKEFFLTPWSFSYLLLTSFLTHLHTVFMVPFGGHLPSSSSF